MAEMEPPDTFAFTLRGYQKQALWYIRFYFTIYSLLADIYQLDALIRKWSYFCSGSSFYAPSLE